MNRPPMTSPTRFSLLALALALGLSGSACDARGGTHTISPTGPNGVDSGLAPQGGFEGESMAELAARLEKLVESQDAMVAAANQDTDKCEDTCELSRSICDVKTKMCRIADEQVTNDEFQNLCRKAKQRCGDASQSCIRCVEHHERASQNGDGADCRGESSAPEPAEPEPAKQPEAEAPE